MRTEALVCCLLLSCAKASDVAKPTPAATLKNPVNEEALTTVTLTARAVERLGLKTAPLQHREAARERVIAAELLVPPGQSLLVSAPMSGVAIVPGSLVPGARVKRGQLLLRLAPLPTPAELNAAEARLDIAKKRAQRNAELVKEGAVAERSNEDAQLELALAEANLAASRPGASGRASIPLFASRDGVLRDLRVADGQTVAAGVPLFQLDSLAQLWVRAPVPSSLATATSATSVRSLGAAVTRPVTALDAPPSADPLAATVDRFFLLDNHDGAFRPGQRVLVSFALGGETPSPVIAASAVMLDLHGGEWVYEALGENRFARRRVQVRSTLGGDVVLASAPVVGTSIVITGATELFGVEFGAGH